MKYEISWHKHQLATKWTLNVNKIKYLYIIFQENWFPQIKSATGWYLELIYCEWFTSYRTDKHLFF